MLCSSAIAIVLRSSSLSRHIPSWSIKVSLITSINVLWYILFTLAAIPQFSYERVHLWAWVSQLAYKFIHRFSGTVFFKSRINSGMPPRDSLIVDDGTTDVVELANAR
jgi:hypothetical protein